MPSRGDSLRAVQGVVRPLLRPGEAMSSMWLWLENVTAMPGFNATSRSPTAMTSRSSAIRAMKLGSRSLVESWFARDSGREGITDIFDARFRCGPRV